MKKSSIDDDVNKFITDLELSAKKIIKEANKRSRNDDGNTVTSNNSNPLGKNAHYRRDNNALPSLRSFQKTGSVLVNAGKAVLSSSELSEKKSTTKLQSNYGTGNDIDEYLGSTKLMKYSIPKMMVSMSADTMNLGNLHKSALGKVKTTKESPVTSFDDFPVQRGHESPTKETSVWNLRMHATNVLGGKTQGNIDPSKVQQVSLPLKSKTGRRLELAGPIDWASRGLRCKYRGEVEREEAWLSWKAASAYALQAFESGVKDVIPVIAISRHPLYVTYDFLIDKENVGSHERSRSRLRMKRFVLDVHEIWLTNLQHLIEHQPSSVLSRHRGNTGGSKGSTMTEYDNSLDDTRNGLPPYTSPNTNAYDQVPSSSSAGTGMNKSGGELNESNDEGIGLSGRRDTGALLALESQIQSVSQRRSLKRAYYTDINMYHGFSEDLDRIWVHPRVDTGPLSASIQLPVHVKPEIETLIDHRPFHVPVTSTQTMGVASRTHLVLVSVHRMIRNATIDSDHNSNHSHTHAHGQTGDKKHSDTPLSLWRITSYHTLNMQEISIVVEEAAVLALLGKGNGSNNSNSSSSVHNSSVSADDARELAEQLLPHITLTVKEIDDDNNDNNNNDDSNSTEGTGSGVSQFRSLVIPGWEIKLVTLSMAIDHLSQELSANSLFSLSQLWNTQEGHAGLYDNWYVRPESYAQLHQWEDVLHRASPSMSLLLSGGFEQLVTDYRKQRLEWASTTESRSSFEHTETIPGACAIGRVGLWGLGEGYGRQMGYTDLSYTRRLENTARSSAEEVMMHISALLAEIGDVDDEETVNVKASSRHKLRRCAGDFSQVSAMFNRLRNQLDNPPGSSSHGSHVRYMMFKAVLLFALEATEIFLPEIYWEDPAVHANPESKRGPQPGFGPDKWPLEHITDPNPVSTVAYPIILMETPLVNALQERLSLLATIFDDCPTALVEAPGHGHVRTHFVAVRSLNEEGRGWKGFRCMLTVNMMDSDPVLPTVVFGISELAATPNATGINTRNIWHATQTITETINRPRLAMELIYIIAIHTTSGSNEPDVFTVLMRGGEFLHLRSKTFNEFEKEYDEVKELRERFTRKLALEGKIEASEIILKARKKDLKQSLRRELQAAVEKRMRKGYHSERGWKRRYELSVHLETQGDWEKRRCEKSGLIFFHQKPRKRKIKAALQQQQQLLNSTQGVAAADSALVSATSVLSSSSPSPMKMNLLQGLGILERDDADPTVEQFAKTCQWEIPPTWVGDPLADAPPSTSLHSSLQNRSGTAAAGSPSLSPSASPSPMMMSTAGGSSSMYGGGDTAQWPAIKGSGQTVGFMTSAEFGPGDGMGMDADAEADAFEEPLEDWAPAPTDDDNDIENMNSNGNGIESAQGPRLTRFMRTPGTAPRGDRRWNTETVPSSSLSQSRGGGGGSALADRPRTAASAVDLEAIAEKLISNDELMSLLARRLGLPEPKKATYKGPVPLEPRGRNTASGGDTGVGISGGDDDEGSVESISVVDDLWSDVEEEDDGEGALAEAEMEALINAEDDALRNMQPLSLSHSDSMLQSTLGSTSGTSAGGRGKIPKKKKNQRFAAKSASGSTSSAPHQVTFLNLEGIHASDTEGEGEGDDQYAGGERPEMGPDHTRGLGWRKLPRPEVAANFYQRCCASQTMGQKPVKVNATISELDFDPRALNANTPTYLLPISPVDACVYTPPDFTIPVESIFIRDARGDFERSMAALERHVKREQDFAQNIPTEDLLLKQAQDLENTTVDKAIARQYREDADADVPVPVPASKTSRSAPQLAVLAVERAIMAAKNDNVANMEEALEENISIDSADQYGNSLLMLAAQQGSKRMCKFLLRRGANLNHQNVSGNTCLHYALAYSKPELAQYLISKGANDSILNASGLTCYEGISYEKGTELLK